MKCPIIRGRQGRRGVAASLTPGLRIQLKKPLHIEPGPNRSVRVDLLEHVLDLGTCR